MCRHCERLVEDREHKPLVHEFMALLAEKINRLHRERGIPSTVTADDVEFKADVPNPEYRGPSSGASPAVRRFLYKELMESFQ